MAKYRVLNAFVDVYTKERYEVGQLIDMTVKRATEAENNLKKHGVDFLERISEEKE